MSNINTNTKHSIVNCRLAIASEHSDNTKGITNVLKAAFNEYISEGFLFDFSIDNEQNFKKIKPKSELDDGEIFELHKMYMVLIRDTQSNEDWVKIETCIELESLSEDELRAILKDKVSFKDDDTILVANISTSKHVII